MQGMAFQISKQICGLAGVFTGVGFVAKGGRRPQKSDCGFIPGPVDITCDEGRIVSVEQQKVVSVKRGRLMRLVCTPHVDLLTLILILCLQEVGETNILRDGPGTIINVLQQKAEGFTAL